MPNKQSHNIVIFKPKGKLPEISVNLKDENVWVNLNQLVTLFQRDKSVISRHMSNIFKSNELQRKSVVANFATTAKDGKTYQVDYYNLDMIISLGYRINSRTATHFRIWATNVLKEHLVRGFTIREERLITQAQKYLELQKSVKLLENVLSLDEITQEQARGIIEVVTDYAYALDIIDQYDFKKLSLRKTTQRELFKLEYNDAIQLIQNLKKQFGRSDIFGVPKDESFKSSIAAIYQSAGGKDAYPSIEEKAAHLIYFVTKNHSFIDGNKRIAATLFIYFLNQNRILYRKDGSKRIPDTTLVALAVLIAQSKPEEKDTIIKVIVNLINRNIL